MKMDLMANNSLRYQQVNNWTQIMGKKLFL